MGRVLILAVVLLAGWLVWRRYYRGHASTAAVSPKDRSPADLAHTALVRGNTCLRAGEWAAAIAAFHQAQALAPLHPHVAGRLVEAERQQREAHSLALASATGEPASRAPSAQG